MSAAEQEGLDAPLQLMLESPLLKSYLKMLKFLSHDLPVNWIELNLFHFLWFMGLNGAKVNYFLNFRVVLGALEVYGIRDFALS